MIDFSTYADPGSLPANESLRVARLLSLEVSDTLGLARSVSAGLSVNSADGLASLLGVGRIVGSVIPEATLRRSRSSNKPLSREHSERLYEISRVTDLCGQIFHGDRQKIEAFLHRSHALLEGVTPFDMARSSSAGANAVIVLLQQLDAGVAV